MADPYWRSAPPTDRDPRAAFPGYLPQDGSALASQHLWGASNFLGPSAEVPRNDILPIRPGGYSLDDLTAIGSHATPIIGGLTPGAGIRAFTPLNDPVLVRDVALGIKPGLADLEHSDPLRKSVGLSTDESNILYVDGLPTDCTRREVAHLFRPFIGFKEIRVVHKEPRRTGDKAHVLCFVEFNDAKCALTALEALQGYKFDNKKPDAPVLRIQFAKFPFHPPNHDDHR